MTHENTDGLATSNEMKLYPGIGDESVIQKRQTITIDGINYDDIVPKAYRFNPMTEDLLYGDELMDGMVVLAGPASERYNEQMPEMYNAGLPVSNRWCEVSKARQEDDRKIYFVGLYADGQKVVRNTDLTAGWYVKKDSIPVKDTRNENDES